MVSFPDLKDCGEGSSHAGAAGCTLVCVLGYLCRTELSVQEVIRNVDRHDLCRHFHFNTHRDITRQDKSWAADGKHEDAPPKQTKLENLARAVLQTRFTNLHEKLSCGP